KRSHILLAALAAAPALLAAPVLGQPEADPPVEEGEPDPGWGEPAPEPAPAPAPAPPPPPPPPPQQLGYPAPAYQPPATRQGFTAELNLGLGLLRASVDGGGSDSEFAIAGLNVGLGGFVTPRVAITGRIA